MTTAEDMYRLYQQEIDWCEECARNAERHQLDGMAAQFRIRAERHRDQLARRQRVDAMHPESLG